MGLSINDKLPNNLKEIFTFLRNKYKGYLYNASYLRDLKLVKNKYALNERRKNLFY